jgi:hypothetical protein
MRHKDGTAPALQGQGVAIIASLLARLRVLIRLRRAAQASPPVDRTPLERDLLGL